MDRLSPSHELDLAIARSRAAEYVPFSPAWDAAMGRVEELERWLSDGDQAEDGEPTCDGYAVMAANSRL